MARYRSNNRRRKVESLHDKGLSLCVLGAVLLIAPLFLGNSSALHAVASGLHTPGILMLVAGFALLGLDKLQKRGNPVPVQEDLTSSRERHPVAAAPESSVVQLQKSAHRPRAAESPVVRQTRSPNDHLRQSHWSPEVFSAIEWRRFEAVCEALFAQAGFETKSQSHGADGGVDIWLYSRNAEGPVAVVQCKHWQGKSVGVKEMREFFGVMASHNLRRGTYATTSTYTPDAQKFASDNGINALDGKGLLALINKRTPEQQHALLDVAYKGEYWRPTCASAE